MTEFRVPRKDFIAPRCVTACPAGVDVPRYIRAVRQGKFDDAVAIVREKIPFPTVCADACFAPCEDACAYRQYGDPVAIRALKRAAVDRETGDWKKARKAPKSNGRKIAVIGAGPAGLTAAYYLANTGAKVTIFDAFDQPGGAMRYSIPNYRLPIERLDRDVDYIMAQGIEFQGGQRIESDSIERLTTGFDAVCITVGSSQSARIPLEGVDKPGFFWGLEFLRDVAQGKTPSLGKSVAVIGGGNVAIDVALTVKRLGAEEVNIFCLESREEMPAHPWEISLAEEEGIVVNNTWAPKRVLGGERVEGLALMKCLSVIDDACNFDPVYDDQITHRIPVDTVIAAIGQTPLMDFLNSFPEVKTKSNGIVVAEDLMTDRPGVFAAGDIVTGPSSIIGAISQGRVLAISIDKYLGGDGDISEVLAPPEEEVTLRPFPEILPRCEMPHLKGWERSGNFDQVETGFSEFQALREASRCLECDARKFEVVVNTSYCKECGYCAEVCSMQVFGPAAGFNAKGYKPMETKSSDWCVGCFKCFFTCPDFAIDVREITA